MTIGEVLRAARDRTGMTQGEVADRLGVSQPAVASWESGATMPRLDRIRQVAEVYGVDPEELIPEVAA